MSVLIHGMKMPETCLQCPMQFGGFCYVMPPEIDDVRVAPTVDEAWVQKKPDWCPLVELPEKHGDLIDRDAMKKDYKMGNDCNDCETDWKSCQYDTVYSKMDFCGWLDDAPVVIEAEDEE